MPISQYLSLITIQKRHDYMCHIENRKVSHWQVTVKIGFRLDH
ncbi:MAG: hypothetical protein HPY30_01155 [Gammaproteobacteria bacterium (ex Lamellibrachia satsuma)]|nr:MAG: hypothetical protein HPY30_01155 [Gammaproteobacteria bacterium (ex Lamellibrachia satsuma)]